MSEEKVEVSQTDKPVSAKKAAAKKTASRAAAEKTSVIVDSVKVEEAVIDKESKVITGPAKTKPARSSNLKSDEGNSIASKAADAALNKKVDTEVKKEKNISETVALWSDSNIRWSDVGQLSKGYNIVKKESEDKWLTRRGVRNATAEEIATYYGK